jgi:hypothetical protein
MSGIPSSPEREPRPIAPSQAPGPDTQKQVEGWPAHPGAPGRWPLPAGAPPIEER